MGYTNARVGEKNQKMKKRLPKEYTKNETEKNFFNNKRAVIGR